MLKLSLGNVITYKRRGDRDHLSLVPSLHNWSVDAFDCVTKLMEITADQLVIWEFLVQRVEELHQSCGDVLRHAHVGAKWYQAPQIMHEARALKWVSV